MKSRHLLCCLIALAAAAVLPTLAQTPASEEAGMRKYTLIWEDSFGGTGYDTCSWSKIPRGHAPWQRHMSADDRLYEVRDGELILRGIVNPDRNADPAPYLTGGLYTRGKRTLCHGKIEVSARLHGARGAWPAIWILPEQGGWPDGGEIDLMERLNFDSIVYQTVHSRYTETLGRTDYPRHSQTGPIRPDDFNVYAVEILPDRILLSINGVLTLDYPRIEAPEEARQFPFGTPYYLLVDMQIGGDWVGPVEPSHLPVEMEVDWVRFYRLDE